MDVVTLSNRHCGLTQFPEKGLYSFSQMEEKIMTIGTLTILAVTGSLVLLKLGIMAMVVVLWARALSSDGPLFLRRSVLALQDITEKHR